MNDASTSLADAPTHTEEPDARKIYLVGNSNVGKSVLFNALTGSYAIVSNYHGIHDKSITVS
jgi:ferrous iron transport protein B